MAAHGKAQRVLRVIATIKTDQPAGLGTSQAHTKQHQAVSLVPSSLLAPVLLFPAHYSVSAHPTTNAGSKGRLSDGSRVTAWAPACFPTAQIASRIEQGTIWEEEQILSHLIGTFSKTDHSQD